MSMFFPTLIIFFFFYSVLCPCSANVLCLFICMFAFFYTCVLVLPIFYASLFIFFFCSCQWLCFAKCSMPLYYICSFLLCRFLFLDNVLCLIIYMSSFLLSPCIGVANALCLFIYIVFFSLVSVAQFCQWSMTLYLYCFPFVCVCGRCCRCSMPLFCIFLFFGACVLVLPMFYASFIYIFCLYFGFANNLCLFIYNVSLLLYLWLGFANVICILIYMLVFLCACGSVLPMFYASLISFFFLFLFPTVA